MLRNYNSFGRLNANSETMVVAIARLPDHVQVPELVITPLYQDYV